MELNQIQSSVDRKVTTLVAPASKSLLRFIKRIVEPLNARSVMVPVIIYKFPHKIAIKRPKKKSVVEHMYVEIMEEENYNEANNP